LPYEVFDKKGTFITSGTTDAAGVTERILTNGASDLIVFIGNGSWEVEEFVESGLSERPEGKS
jgi:hypothetical protein